MVSDLDTENKANTGDVMTREVTNQSKDEILDYLLGTSSSETQKNHHESFESLRKFTQKKQQKIKSNIKKPLSVNKADKLTVFLSLLSGIRFLKPLAFKSLKLSFVQLRFALLFASKLNKVEFLLPFEYLFNNLKSKEVPSVEPSEETIADIKAKVKPSTETIAAIKAKIKPLKPILSNITQTSLDIFDTSKEIVIDYAKTTNDFINDKFPDYRKTFVSSMVLVGCGLMTLVSQLAIQNNNPKEDPLNSRKLAAVNWNVNGHVSDRERDHIKNLIATGQIKVLPKAKVASNKIQLLTKTNTKLDKSVSPDTSFMVISSNSIYHSVNQAESILSISQKYKVSISDLISANPETDLINLKSGTKLVIPNTSEISDVSLRRPSRLYSKIPRTLIASRSFAGVYRHYRPIYRRSYRSRSNYNYNYGNSYNAGNSYNSGNSSMLWPLPSSQAISSGYGHRWGGFHPGVDITAPVGTPIVATKDGVVTSSGWSGGYGKCIIIDHGSGISTRYGHASSLFVSSGQVIKAGQVIGRVGSTGWSTGPHLHYEVMVNGKHNNPMSYF